MPLVVQKFGGSSVADVEKLKRVARIVSETACSGNQVVAVISAMGDTTDHLIDLAHQVSRTPSRREFDMLTSTGERISMSLLCMALQDLGHEAVSFTGSQAGIITNDRHSNARIIEVRPWRIEDELERGHIVVVAGFQGMSYKREITTLGRGGTDATAVALTAALGADRCEIFSDVVGVYTADPRKVTTAELMNQIHYDQMIALARGGAVVMNQQAVEYARSKSIEIHTRLTANGASGTTIGSRVPLQDFAGVSTQEKMALLSHFPQCNGDIQSCLNALDTPSLQFTLDHAEWNAVFCETELPGGITPPAWEDTFASSLERNLFRLTVVGNMSKLRNEILEFFSIHAVEPLQVRWEFTQAQWLLRDLPNLQELHDRLLSRARTA